MSYETVSLAEKAAVSPRADPTAEALLAATQAIQSTAKWIAAAFAAVGGALITGISLSDLGGLSGSDRWLAICGALVGVAGVLGVIMFATRVLVSPFVTLNDFRQVKPARPRKSFWNKLNPAPSQRRDLGWVLARLEENRSLGTRRQESVVEFIDWLDGWLEERIWARRDALPAEKRHDEAVRALEEANHRWKALSDSAQKSSEAANAKKAVEAAEIELAEAKDESIDVKYRVIKAQIEVVDFEWLADRLRVTAQYEYVKVRFDTSRIWIVICGALAGVGVLLFAVFTGGS